MNKTTQEKIYAGVVGKIIGVYLGRPVEGWSYENISSRFNEIQHYVNDSTKAPLIVPDDDISGTFAFIRALRDNGNRPDLPSALIGEAWLNYIIEDKTILWWGGLARSTEHTAYLRLKSGIAGPLSGSKELNGESMATQIGAQIFIDSWALVNPDNPDRAAYLAREAARVSHDGIAVEAAVFLATMEAMAFSERNLQTLIAEGLRYTDDRLLKRLVDDIRNVCAKAHSWQDARNYIAEHHGYDKYLGNCPMVTNHLVVLAALLMGGDDFQKSISIAVSSGWDTDCNAGNVGCFNGIRLGLDGIDQGADFRTPVADRMLVVTSDGGACITDAVIETRELIDMALGLDGEQPLPRKPRFSFEFPGSLQGFMIHPDIGLSQAVSTVSNALETLGTPGLRIDYKHLGRGMKGVVAVETFTDLQPRGKDGTSYFEVLTSPSLYETQTINAIIQGLGEKNPRVNLFVEYYTDNGSLLRAQSNTTNITRGNNRISWMVPTTNGFPVYRAGLELHSDERMDGSLILVSMDWQGAPANLSLKKSYAMSPGLTPWTTNTIWLKSFMSSAKNFYPDYTTTFSISHPEENGVVTLGSADWKDYTIGSSITFMQQEGAGIIARSRGHRRYYAAILVDSEARIIMRKDDHVKVLAKYAGGYTIDSKHQLALRVKNDHLQMFVDGTMIAEVNDTNYSCGAAGFMVNTGAILVDGMNVVGC